MQHQPEQWYVVTIRPSTMTSEEKPIIKAEYVQTAVQVSAVGVAVIMGLTPAPVGPPFLGCPGAVVSSTLRASLPLSRFLKSR